MANSASEEVSLDFLNKDFFKAALENGLGVNDIQVKSVNISKATAAGDNYSSFINRACVTYSRNGGTIETVSLITKSIPYTGARDLLFEMDIPAKEKYYYQNIIPKMEALLPGTKFAAKLFYSVDKPMFTMVFEDLKAQGFILGKRQRGLNESESKRVLELLGKYHAASMYLINENPETVQGDWFKYGIFSPKTIDEPLLKVFFIDSLQTAIDVVNCWKGYEKYVDKMKNIYSNIKERLLEIVTPVDNEPKVILHGDLWVNNLMLKYKPGDTSQAEEVLFLDFQNYYVITPAIDLNYFFTTSIQYEVLANRKALIDCYYNSLRSSLEYLKYKNIPSMDCIMAEIRRKSFYSFISAVSVLPILCIDENDSKDCSLEMFTDENAAEKKRLKACQSKRYEQVMKFILKYVDEMGGLD